MPINLGKTLITKSYLNTNLNKWNFNLDESIKRQIGFLRAAIYLDKQNHILFIYLKVKDFNEYEKFSSRYSNAWWSNLTPICAVNQGKKSILDYVWQDIFQIEDKEND